jgi:hypothetical protein
MSEEGRKIEVCLVGSGTLWLTAVALLVLSPLLGIDGMKAWGLLTGMFATVWSLHIIIARAKRAVVRAMVRELAFATRDNQEVSGLHAVP